MASEIEGDQEAAIRGNFGLAMLRRIPPPGHPPRLLTREQKDLWDSGCPIVPVIRDETNTPGFQVLSFGWVCQLEGIPIPTRT